MQCGYITHALILPPWQKALRTILATIVCWQERSRANKWMIAVMFYCIYKCCVYAHCTRSKRYEAICYWHITCVLENGRSTRESTSTYKSGRWSTSENATGLNVLGGAGLISCGWSLPWEIWERYSKFFPNRYAHIYIWKYTGKYSPQSFLSWWQYQCMCYVSTLHMLSIGPILLCH